MLEEERLLTQCCCCPCLFHVTNWCILPTYNKLPDMPTWKEMCLHDSFSPDCKLLSYSSGNSDTQRISCFWFRRLFECRRLCWETSQSASTNSSLRNSVSDLSVSPTPHHPKPGLGSHSRCVKVGLGNNQARPLTQFSHRPCFKSVVQTSVRGSGACIRQFKVL